MFDAHQNLEVTQDELVVIEAALETQTKILTVQAGAGGSGARRRLNEVKKVLTRISDQREGAKKRRRWYSLGWFAQTRTAS